MKLSLSFFFLFVSFQLLSQQSKDSISTLQILDEVILKVTRLPSKNLRTPIATSIVNTAENALLKPQLSLNESLISVPGLFAQNAYNYNQDLRVSIRGFGARSAFGIRGVKLVLDGIPETTPDGQGQIDNVLVGLIDRIEVLRGPSASLYGNAAGGVIYINTLTSIKDKIRINYTAGSFGLNLAQALINLNRQEKKALLAVNYSQSLGYREHSGFRQLQTNYKSLKTINKDHQLLWQVNFTHSPLAYDSGGITQEQLIANPRAARDANIKYNSREAIDHFKTGWQLTSKLNNAVLNNHFYTAFRNFKGFLPFQSGGLSTFKRYYWGLGSTYQRNFDRSQLQFGFSLDQQIDDRKRYDNLEGIQGELQSKQEERYSNSALYITAIHQLGPLSFHSGLRSDYISLGILGNTQKKTYLVANPSLGIHFPFGKQSGLYTTYSKSFETPTLSELSNDPNGSLGFNANLKPNKAQNMELGFKYQGSNSQFEIALFTIQSTDELLAYSIADYPGRTFYANAGKTKRKGLELSIFKNWGNFKFQQSYTYSDFRFNTSEAQHQLPGIPKHNFFNKLTQRIAQSIQLSLSSVYWGELYANNSNSVRVNDQFYSNLSMSKSYQLSNGKLDLKLGINNLWNSDYYDNIRVNAWGGRYYEPAPERSLYVGVQWGIN